MVQNCGASQASESHLQVSVLPLPPSSRGISGTSPSLLGLLSSQVTWGELCLCCSMMSLRVNVNHTMNNYRSAPVALSLPEKGLRQELWPRPVLGRWDRACCHLPRNPCRLLASGTSHGWQLRLPPLACLAQRLPGLGLEMDLTTELRGWEARSGASIDG
jgi:hypothetical protein